MNIDTVVLNLKDYNELKEFKYEISKGNTFMVSSNSRYYHEYQQNCDTKMFISESESVKIISKENEILSKKLDELQKKYDKNNYILKSLKNKSFFQLFKWVKTFDFNDLYKKN